MIYYRLGRSFIKLIYTNFMFKVKALILEVAPVKEYEGSKYQTIIARVENKLLRFKVDISKVEFKTEDLDKEFTLSLDLFGSATTSAYVRVVSAE